MPRRKHKISSPCEEAHFDCSLCGESSCDGFVETHLEPEFIPTVNVGGVELDEGDHRELFSSPWDNPDFVMPEQIPLNL